LQQLIAAKAAKQTRMLSRQHTDPEVRTAANEMTGLATELDQVQTRIRQASPQYAALTRPSPLSLKEIQTEVLDSDTALLEHVIGTPKRFLGVVTASSIDIPELPAREEIESVAKRVYDVLTARNRSLAAEKAATTSAGEMLLAPAASKIAGKRLLIVAEGVLQYLPFGSLPDPAEPTVPLIMNHELVSAPSASVIAVLRRETIARAPAPNSIAIFPDPVSSPQDPRLPASAPRRLSDSQFLPLRFSRTEAESIVRLAPPNSSLTALGFDATRDAVLSPL